MEFREMNLSPQILRAIEKMNFITATPVQEKTIHLMLQKGDVIVQAPTGSGKTCAFGIPVVQSIDTKKRATQCVILCPTRELAIQINRVLHSLTLYMDYIRICPVYGGTRINTQILALRQNPQIIVATPGRLMDHIRRRTVVLNQVNCLILDEADRMLDMGFREDINTILQIFPKERQTILFSATLAPEIKKIAKEYQNNAEIVHIKQETLTVDTVKQYYIKIPKNYKITAIKLFLSQKCFDKALIFVATKSMADSLAQELITEGFTALAIHSDLPQRKRDNVMSKYRKGTVKILVATDVVARGIDVESIDAVINFDIPEDIDSYVHRIGRTGRANQNGSAYTFVYAKEEFRLETIMKSTKAFIEPILIDGVVFNEKTEIVSNGRSQNSNRRMRPRMKVVNNKIGRKTRN